jgi:hypothetical protein
MQRVNEFSFYELASKIHPLTEVEDIDLRNVWFEWWHARAALDAIFTQRPLNVCTTAGAKLWREITNYIPEKWEDAISLALPPTANATPDSSKELADWQTSGIREAAKEFETILAAECQVLDTYYISKKGVYSTADLVDHAHYHIPPTTRQEIPEQTKNDFDQAGKCIAFDLPTAGAFHLLRGTEAVLREYYDLGVPGPKKAPPKMRNWGVYIKLLSEHKAEPKVTSLLTHIKDAYRNPVLHPEENYTDERAQVLFGVCISAIVMMMEQILVLRATIVSVPAPVPVASAASIPGVKNP